MDSVKMKKEDLLKELEKNRKKHGELFEEAWEAFAEKAKLNFEERLKAVRNAKKGEKIELHVNLIQPEDHTEDYDRAIAMVQFDVRKMHKLSEAEFAELVQDDWGWKRGFTASYMSNTGKFAR